MWTALLEEGVAAWSLVAVGAGPVGAAVEGDGSQIVGERGAVVDSPYLARRKGSLIWEDRPGKRLKEEENRIWRGGNGDQFWKGAGSVLASVMITIGDGVRWGQEGKKWFASCEREDRFWFWFGCLSVWGRVFRCRKERMKGSGLWGAGGCLRVREKKKILGFLFLCFWFPLPKITKWPPLKKISLAWYL